MVITIIAMLLALLLPAVLSARGAGRRVTATRKAYATRPSNFPENVGLMGPRDGTSVSNHLVLPSPRKGTEFPALPAPPAEASLPTGPSVRIRSILGMPPTPSTGCRILSYVCVAKSTDFARAIPSIGGWK